MSSFDWVQISYAQGRQFELDQKRVLPSYIIVSLQNGVYTLQVPTYCLDGNGKMQNYIMWKLYPQFSQYDFASGQV